MTDTRDIEAAWQDGARALREGRPVDALGHLRRITAAGHGGPVVWTTIALAHGMSGDRAAQRDALQRALALDPRDLRALIMS